MDIIVWLGIAAVMLIVEIITLGLTTIWFTGGALVAAGIAALGGGYTFQILAFSLVSLLLLFVTRPIAQKHMMKNIEKTNAEGLIGTVGLVTETIDNVNGKGTVRLDGKDWTARACDDTTIEAGSKVLVEEIRGVKLIVKKKEEE